MESGKHVQWRTKVRSPFILPGVYVLHDAPGGGGKVVGIGQINQASKERGSGPRTAPGQIVEQWIFNHTANPIQLQFAGTKSYNFLGTVVVYPVQNRLPWPLDDAAAQKPDQYPKQVSDAEPSAANFVSEFPGERGNFSYTRAESTARPLDGYSELPPEVVKLGSRRCWMEILKGPSGVIGYAYGEHPALKDDHTLLRVTQVWRTSDTDPQFPLPSLTRFGAPGNTAPTSRFGWFIAAVNHLPAVTGELVFLSSSDVAQYTPVPKT